MTFMMTLIITVVGARNVYNSYNDNYIDGAYYACDGPNYYLDGKHNNFHNDD